MKSSDRKETLFGALAMLTLALVLMSSYRSGAVDGPDRDGGYRVYATFNRIDGLGAGDAVMMSGIKVGSVEALSLTDSFRARTRLRIERGVDLPFDTAAAIHTDGLFGSKFISLSPGGELDLLEDGDIITYTQDAVIVSELLDLIIAEGKARRAKEASGAD